MCALCLALRKVTGSQVAHNALLQAHSARMQRQQQLLTKPQHSGNPTVCITIATLASLTHACIHTWLAFIVMSR